MALFRLGIALISTSLALGACANGGSPGGSSGDSSAARASDSRSQAPATPRVEVTANSLNVRQEPSPSGAVIGSLKRGERVAAPRDANNGWLFVQSDSGVSGYVSAKYVRSVEPVATSRPPAPAPPAPSAEAKPDYAPAPGTRLASVTPGMTTAQVIEILGAPTSEQNYITGKSFIPYYYGSDTSRMEYKYAGLGRVVFSRNRYSGGLKVVRVEADSSEDGQ